MASELEFTGTLRHEELEGGVWLVDVDDAAPEEVQDAVGPVAQLGATLPAGTAADVCDGSRVRVSARVADAGASIFMAGTELEDVRITAAP